MAAAPQLSRSLPALLRSNLAQQLRNTVPASVPKIPFLSPFRASHSSSSKTSTMASKMSFQDAVTNRRTVYNLKKSSAISDDRIKEIVNHAALTVPSAFNSQSCRLVVLFKAEHDKFWDIVTQILKAHVPEAKWEHTRQRLEMFSGAYGTILFYEDPDPIKKMQTQFPNYADKFPSWAEHTSAMHQFELWTALEAEGLGCNLQHYNPLPDQKAAEVWGLPLEWSLKAQLVFGDPAEGARENLRARGEGEPGRVKFFGA